VATHDRKRLKPKRSAYQKQIRLLYFLSLLAVCAMLAGLLWLLNHSSHLGR
jgi:cytoskeletal protein RodZ